MLGYKLLRRKLSGVRVIFPRAGFAQSSARPGKMTLTTQPQPLTLTPQPLSAPLPRGTAFTVSFDSCVMVGFSQLPVTL